MFWHSTMYHVTTFLPKGIYCIMRACVSMVELFAPCTSLWGDGQRPESIEWIIEDQAFWPSCNLAPPHLPSASRLSFLVFLCVWRRESLVLYKLFNTLSTGHSWSIRFDTCSTRGSKRRGPPYFLLSSQKMWLATSVLSLSRSFFLLSSTIPAYRRGRRRTRKRR